MVPQSAEGSSMTDELDEPRGCAAPGACAAAAEITMLRNAMANILARGAQDEDEITLLQLFRAMSSLAKSNLLELMAITGERNSRHG